MKACVRCTVEKSEREFSKRSSAKDGLASYCKSCANEYHAEWYENNKTKERAQQAEYKAARRDELAAYQRAYAKTHPDECRARSIRHRQENPELYRKYARADAQRRRGAAMDATGRYYFELLRFDPCSYCGGPGGEVDHIDAVGKDGTGHWTNLTGACRRCNAGKFTHPLLTALLQRTP